MKKIAVIQIVISIFLIILSFLSCNKGSLIGPYSEVLLDTYEMENLDYEITFSFVMRNGEPRIKVEQSFNMPRTQWGLQLPNSFMKKEALYRQIEDLKVSNGQYFNNDEYSYVKLVKTSSTQKTSLTYYIKPESSREESFTSPLIEQNFFQFIGSMAIVNPIPIDVDREFDLTINWNVPQDFTLFNSFGAFSETQNVKTSIAKLWDSLFLGGNTIRYQKKEIQGYPVYIAFEGYWDKIKDDKLADIVTKLLETQRKSWGDFDFPYFLISFLSVDADCSATVYYAGTAHQNSFRAYFPKSCKFMPEMSILISHELMHVWIGKKIIVGKERGKIDGKWFTEGFSDYYGRIMAFRAGLLNIRSYFLSLNRDLESYFTSSENKTGLADLINRMYKTGKSNRELEKLPYQEGQIIALRLDKEINKQSNFTASLDDAMKEMLGIAKRNGGSKNFSFDEINSVFSKYISGGMLKYLKSIVNGKILVPPTLDNCASIKNNNFTKYRIKNFYTTSKIFNYEVTGDERSCKKWLY